MSALRELIAFFGVEVDDKKLDHAGEKMEGLAKLAERVGSTIGLAFGLHEISEFLQGQIELAAHIGNTAEILGVATDELQEFRYAALNADVEMEGADKALRFLNKNLGEAVSGNAEAAKTFRELGVDLATVKDGSRSAVSLLPDIADKFLKLDSQAERTALAMKIFGKQGASLLPLLQKGGKELEQYRDEFEELGGGITEAQIKIAEEGEHSIKKMRTAYAGLKATIASSLIPAFTWLVDKLGHAVVWFRALATHSYIVQTALASLAVVVGVLVGLWAILNFEILLVILAFALIVLVVDDIYTMFKGGKSVLGDFIDSMLGVGATKEIVSALSKAVAQGWVELGAMSDAALKLLESMGFLDTKASTSTGSLQDMLDVINGIAEAMRIAAVAVLFLIDQLAKVVAMAKEIPGAFSSLTGAASSGVSKILGGAGGGVALGGTNAEERAGLAQHLGLGGAPTHAAPGAALAAGLGQGLGDFVQHNTVQIDVKGGPANADTGKAVATGVQKGFHAGDMQSAFAAVPGNGGS